MTSLCADLEERLYVAATEYRHAWLDMNREYIKTAALKLEDATRAYKGFVERNDVR